MLGVLNGVFEHDNHDGMIELKRTILDDHVTPFLTTPTFKIFICFAILPETTKTA